MENIIIDVISNVGFPIAVSITLFYQISKSNDTYLNLLRDFQSVIANNTKSVELLNATIIDMQKDMNYRVGDKE